ncbi:MAG: hypothetical protein HYR89_09840 [Actinobacteria bacterium]|nr:hypothetical protein [Actinomycetota bacterium]
MTDIALAVLGGMVAGLLTLAAMRPMFAQPLFARENHRGHVLPTAVGLVVPIALLGIEAVLALIALGVRRGNVGMDGARQMTFLLVVGLGLLGMVDDLAGSGDVRGFRGHLAALRSGRLTTGGLKLVGGGCVALVVCAPYAGLGNRSALHVIRDASLVALAANLGNLLDRAPGRVLKVSAIAFVAVGVMASYESALVGPAFVFGISLILLGGDLREQFMLGDTGANVLGGVLGLALVMATSPPVRLVALVVVLLLNLASERVSFSKVIEAVGALRALDRLGRRPYP